MVIFCRFGISLNKNFMKPFLYTFILLLNIICASDSDWMEEVYSKRMDFFLGKDSLYKYLDKSTLSIIPLTFSPLRKKSDGI